MGLENKVVLVTGSASGIGAACAREAARRGARVVVNYSRSAEEAEQTAETIRSGGGEVLVVQADVSSDEQVRSMVSRVEQAWGGVDVLVNNAGYTSFVDFDDLDGLTDEVWTRTLGVNLMGTWYATRAVAVGMRARGAGAIVNVSSVGGVTASGSSIAYVVSKSGVLTMTKALARTLGPQIRVNAVAAGFVQTRWWGRQGYGDASRVEQLATSVAEKTPLRKVAAPDDIADAVLWLADGAALVTGETILVDAGMHLGAPPVSGRR
ncbi:SDR family oxidoreductase [Pseudonocardia acidicola]|uniref:SDR family oxidoreductase n=1 Tax=Pseudonocardia acidicola TaxID=2724939 RepID=A0ABX1SM34_9PSEU|nr:SDR family oxidoreductase [Pseudonocardia acidicola]